MDKQIEDLQTRIAFQEDMIASLSDRVAAQDLEIETLKKQLRHLNKKLTSLAYEMEDNNDPTDEPPPPHY